MQDTGSRNGIFLNGKLLTGPQFLREGDKIRISDLEFVFSYFEALPEFPGANLDIMAYDGVEDDFLDSGSGPTGLKMTATPEAKLEALMLLNSHLRNALAIEDVLSKVLSSLFDIFPAADRGFVVMQNETGDLIPRCVRTRAAHDETETVRISRTIIRDVMDSGEAILSMDASEDSRFDSSQSIADFSIRSMICAPLTDDDGKPFGAVQIESTSGSNQFREEDADLFSSVAAQAGIVINNARIREQKLEQKDVERVVFGLVLVVARVIAQTLHVGVLK